MGRKQLVREAKRAALTRMEDAARTEQDFKQVVAQWNHLDSNRRRRERYNEVSRPNEEMLHWDKVNASDEKGKLRTGFGRVIPRPLEFQWWRQLIRGDFIDTMFDCPHELHELVADKMISQLLQDLSENHKEILYYSAVRLYSNTYIAAIREQSDRNIRKTLVLLLKNVRDGLAPLIREQMETDFPQVTLEKREFLAWYDEKSATVIDSGDSK